MRSLRCSCRQDLDSRLSTLLFSVHIPSVPLYTPDDASAEPALTVIQNTITATLQDDRRSTSVILAGDFNRHHRTWGGNRIKPRFVEDASDLITFFQANSLHSCLPRETATYWFLNDPGRNSTIDQTETNRPPAYQMPSLPRKLRIGPPCHVLGMESPSSA